MRIILFCTLLALLWSDIAEAAANWRDYLPQCGNNTACAKEQARGRDLWDGQNWDADLKASCSSYVDHTYVSQRNYVLAANCVYDLQTARNEALALEAQTNRDNAEAERARAEARYYRRGGAVIIK